MTFEEYLSKKEPIKQPKGSVILNKDEFILGYRDEEFIEAYVEVNEYGFHYLVDLNSGILYSIKDSNPKNQSCFSIPLSMLHGKTKIVVLEERYLGLVSPDSNKVQILQSDVTKGASTYGGSQPYFRTSHYSSIRLATPKDFEEFNVFMGKFRDKEKYIYRD